MEEFIDLIDDLVKQCKEYWDQCEEYHRLITQMHGTNDPRAHCFGATQNKTQLCYDLLKYYHGFYDDCWKEASVNTLKQEFVDKVKREAAERCVEATKALFIGVISLIEFNMRETIRLYPEHPLIDYIDRKEMLFGDFERIYKGLAAVEQEKWSKFRRKIKGIPTHDSFKRIIEKSRSIGMIEKEEEDVWRKIIDIRNYTVHSNSIPAEDKEFTIDGYTFQFRKGYSIVAYFGCHLFLARKAIDCFFNWSQQIRRIGSVVANGQKPTLRAH